MPSQHANTKLPKNAEFIGKSPGKSPGESTKSSQDSTPKNTPPLLDTLAQLATAPPAAASRGGKISVLKRRAVAKYITNELIFPLIDLHVPKTLFKEWKYLGIDRHSLGADTNSPLWNSYWNTYRCVERLIQKGTEITAEYYCNNRWCIVCNRIRTARMINDYLPVIRKEVEDPYFVTLTIPNVCAKELRPTINEMLRTASKINHKFKERRDYRVKGIRKLECTYNSDTKEYHPHLHYLLSGVVPGQELINNWLVCHPMADRAAQDIRPADDNSLVELFKYTTKIITSKNITRVDGKVVMNAHINALDTIFRAMYRRRVFQPIGIKKIALSEDIGEIQAQDIEDIKSAVDEWDWKQESSDWVNSKGELLTGCKAHEVYTVIQK